MWDLFSGILYQSVLLLNEMSLYLLLGFLFAGVVHIFLNTGFIVSHLGKSDTRSVVNAALFGIPLPLCSCGVIPAAMSLKKEGASNGAVLSFLITTPTSGVDSLILTYSLLGPFFMLYRVTASFLTGVVAGIISNITAPAGNKRKPSSVQNGSNCRICPLEEEHRHSIVEKIKNVLIYAFKVLLADSGKWIILGVVVGGCIAYFVPEGLLGTYFDSKWQAMIAMLLVGIPMYVCATGSIPIAVALLLKGLDPGAVFVFLLTGPATNTVTMTVIARDLGKKQLVIYLLSIAAVSLVLGYYMNVLSHLVNMPLLALAARHGDMIPLWIKAGASLFLIIMILYFSVKKMYVHNVKGD